MMGALCLRCSVLLFRVERFVSILNLHPFLAIRSFDYHPCPPHELTSQILQPAKFKVQIESSRILLPSCVTS